MAKDVASWPIFASLQNGEEWDMLSQPCLAQLPSFAGEVLPFSLGAVRRQVLFPELSLHVPSLAS